MIKGIFSPKLFYRNFLKVLKQKYICNTYGNHGDYTRQHA